jgi:hypothetical protein
VGASFTKTFRVMVRWNASASLVRAAVASQRAVKPVQLALVAVFPCE